MVMRAARAVCPSLTCGALHARCRDTAGMDLTAATTLVVTDGMPYNPRRRRDNNVFHIERDRAVIARVAALLSDIGDEEYSWMEWPTASLTFLEGRESLVSYGILWGGVWVRTPGNGDCTLRSTELSEWLRAVGVHTGAD